MGQMRVSLPCLTKPGFVIKLHPSLVILQTCCVTSWPQVLLTDSACLLPASPLAAITMHGGNVNTQVKTHPFQKLYLIQDTQVLYPFEFCGLTFPLQQYALECCFVHVVKFQKCMHQLPNQIWNFLKARIKYIYLTFPISKHLVATSAYVNCLINADGLIYCAQTQLCVSVCMCVSVCLNQHIQQGCLCLQVSCKSVCMHSPATAVMEAWAHSSTIRQFPDVISHDNFLPNL